MCRAKVKNRKQKIDEQNGTKIICEKRECSWTVDCVRRTGGQRKQLDWQTIGKSIAYFAAQSSFQFSLPSPPPPTIQAPRIAYRTAKSDWQFAQTNCSCRNKLAATCRKVTANQQAQVVVAVAAAATARFPVWLLFDGLLKPV